MTILQQIPLLSGEPDQTADITIADTPYTLRMLWNERFQYWALSLYDRNDDPVILNIKIVPNYPLVSRYKKTTFAGDLYFMHSAGKTYDPGFDDVGGDSGYALYYYDPETAIDYPTPLAAVGYLASIWDANVVGGPSSWDVVDGVGTSVWL